MIITITWILFTDWFEFNFDCDYQESASVQNSRNQKTHRFCFDCIKKISKHRQSIADDGMRRKSSVIDSVLSLQQFVPNAIYVYPLLAST